MTEERKKELRQAVRDTIKGYDARWPRVSAKQLVFIDGGTNEIRDDLMKLASASGIYTPVHVIQPQYEEYGCRGEDEWEFLDELEAHERGSATEELADWWIVDKYDPNRPSPASGARAIWLRPVNYTIICFDSVRGWVSSGTISTEQLAAQFPNATGSPILQLDQDGMMLAVPHDVPEYKREE